MPAKIIKPRLVIDNSSAKSIRSILEKKRGYRFNEGDANATIFCPFHDDQNTPNLSVVVVEGGRNKKTNKPVLPGTWFCPVCNEGGLWKRLHNRLNGKTDKANAKRGDFKLVPSKRPKPIKKDLYDPDGLIWLDKEIKMRFTLHYGAWTKSRVFENVPWEHQDSKAFISNDMSRKPVDSVNAFHHLENNGWIGVDLREADLVAIDIDKDDKEKSKTCRERVVKELGKPLFEYKTNGNHRHMFYRLLDNRGVVEGYRWREVQHSAPEKMCEVKFRLILWKPKEFVKGMKKSLEKADKLEPGRLRTLGDSPVPEFDKRQEKADPDLLLACLARHNTEIRTLVNNGRETTGTKQIKGRLDEGVNYEKWMPLDEDDEELLKCTLNKEQGLNFNAGHWRTSLAAAYSKSRVHPFPEYLTNLPEARGLDVLPRMFSEMWDCDEDDRLAEFASKWLVCAVVASALRHKSFNPFDVLIPVLEGPINIAKTNCWRKLFPTGGDYDACFAPGFAWSGTNKEIMEFLEDAILVEWGEFAGIVRDRENSWMRFNNFLSKGRDKWRKAYGRQTENNPRMAVLIATTNHKRLYNDPGVLRRFLPLSVAGKKGVNSYDWLEKHRDVVLSEAIWHLNNEGMPKRDKIFDLQMKRGERSIERVPEEEAVIEYFRAAVAGELTFLDSDGKALYDNNGEKKKKSEIVVGKNRQIKPFQQKTLLSEMGFIGKDEDNKAVALALQNKSAHSIGRALKKLGFSNQANVVERNKRLWHFPKSKRMPEWALELGLRHYKRQKPTVDG